MHTDRVPLRWAAPLLFVTALIAGCALAAPSEATEPPAEATQEPEEGATEGAIIEVEATEAPGGAAARLQRPLVIVDQAGQALGDGVVSLYAPQSMALDETAEVRLEIQVNAPLDTVLTLNPPPSPTPVIGTPRPTATPMPLIEAQFIAVREFMGAVLRGRDARHFTIDPVPPDGLRRMEPFAVNWWKWNLTPVGPEAVGTNALEVTIFLPTILEDGTSFTEETNIIPFEVMVLAPPTPTPLPTDTPTPSPTATHTATPVPTPSPTPTPTAGERLSAGLVNFLDTWVGRLAGLAALIGSLYAGYRSARVWARRRHRPARTEPPGRGQGNLE